MRAWDINRTRRRLVLIRHPPPTSFYRFCSQFSVTTSNSPFVSRIARPMSWVSIHRYFASSSQYLRFFVTTFAILFSMVASSERIAAVTSSSLPANATFPIVYIASAYVDCGSPLVKDGCATLLFQSTSPIRVASTETLYAFSTISYMTTETAAAAFAAQQKVSASSSCNIVSSASTTSLCTSTVSSSTSESTSTYCASSALTLYSNSHSTGQTGSSVSNVLVSTFGTLEIATITLSATETLSPEFTTFVSRSFSRTTEERNYKPSLIPTTGPPLPAGFPYQGVLKRDIQRPQVQT